MWSILSIHSKDIMNCLRMLCFVLNGIISTFASESQGEDGFFMKNVEYKYTMLVLSVLNFGLLVLIVTMFIILWKWWKIGKCLKKSTKLKVKQESIKIESVAPEQKEKPHEESNVGELPKKQVFDDSTQYLQCQEEQPIRFVYEEISEVPKLPPKKKRIKKTQNSCIKRIFTKNGSKTQKDTITILGETESLKPKEYSKLTEQALGPYVYDEIKIDPTNGSLPRIVTSDFKQNALYTEMPTIEDRV